MKKYAFLGAVSAIALMCSPVLAGPPGGSSGTDVDVNVEDVQVPVNNSTANATEIEVEDSLNGNDVGSYNTDNSQDNDVGVTANQNQLLSNNTTTITDNSKETDVEVEDNNLNSFNKTDNSKKIEIEDNNLNSFNTAIATNTAIDNSVDVKFDDVMANVTFQAMNVGGVAAMQTPAGGFHKGGSGGFTSTGSIGGVNVQSTKGITASNFNTGVGALANSISLNAQVNNP